MTAPKDAVFRIEDTGKTIRTHFNPATLSLTVSTKLSEGTGKKKGSRQAVNEGSAKLSVDLVYDTTSTLENVCDQTVEVARLLGEKGKPPPRVSFDWGAFKFTGVVDSFKETLEFFSADGIPLRSAVSISMTQDEDIYSRGATGQRAAGWIGGAGSSAGDPNAEVPPPPPGGSTTVTATQGGDPAAGRAIAAQNGEESMRFPRSPALTVDASAQLAPPVSFAGANVSLSASASFSLGVSASAGLGASAGFGLSASASFGTNASAGIRTTFGGSASAGVSASQGAFSGLRALPVSALRPTRIDTSRLVTRVELHDHATDDGAVFELGGRVRSLGSRLGGGPRVRIRFEGGES